MTFVGGDAEFFDHFGDAYAHVLHRVVHDHALVHELHEVLVGRDDGGGRACFAGDPRISGDQIIGLVPSLLEAGDLEGLHRLADKRKLRE